MIWLLDPGHGGMAFDEYLNPGKRSPEVPPGIFEGQFNRRVCDQVQAKYETAIRNNPYKSKDTRRVLNIAPGPINIPLTKKRKQGGQCRVEFVNDVYRRFKPEPIALISVHANAAGKSGWSDANGFVIFTSRNASKNSRKLSSFVAEHMGKIPDLSARGTGEKQANFTIIHKTRCPAILVECGFMTNKEEAAFLASFNGVSQISKAIYDGMLEYERMILAD